MTASTPAKHVDVETALGSAFEKSGYRELNRLHCEVADGVLVLSGSVPSFYLKQVAQNIALRLLDGMQIDNQVNVESLSIRQSPSDSADRELRRCSENSENAVHKS